MEPPADTSVARYYSVARTVHLERVAEYRPGWFFYGRTRADFDNDLASRTPGVMRASALRVAFFVITRGVRLLELPEPLAVPAWPQTLTVQCAVAIANLFKPAAKRTKVVSYAIENLAPVDKLHAKFKIPRPVAVISVKLLGGILAATSAKIVFGTQDALNTYRDILPNVMRRSRPAVELVWALPRQKERLSDSVRPPTVAFLGTFERRKGIHHLMRAWPLVLNHNPDATLTIIGKSGDIGEVRKFVRQNIGSVILVEDPKRSTIFELLAASKVLVLFSQTTPIWKEQVGLPILEGLGEGCEVVSSDQTGIAEWLRDNGHHVLPQDSSDEELADAIGAALRADRSPAAIVSDLPLVDTRKTADERMFDV